MASLLNLRPHFLWWTLEHNELCLNTGSLTPHLSHVSRESLKPPVECVCSPQYIFSVVWSSVLISVTWVAHRRLVYKFFGINNRANMFVCPVPKISEVVMKWRRRASHLGRFTLWHNGRRAAQLGRFTLWHNGRRATSQLGRLLCVAQLPPNHTTR